MPLFRRKSRSKDLSKQKSDEAKGASKPAVEGGPVTDKVTQNTGVEWAEAVFQDQGWSNDTLEQKHREALGFPAQHPLTPPSSPPPSKGTPAMSRSRSQPQVLPYHRPWTRHLLSSQAVPQEQKAEPASPSSYTAAGPLPMSQSWSQASSISPSKKASSYMPPPALSNGSIPDFRISPNAHPRLSPAQRKQSIDAARRITLKKAKAPSEFNILVMGARATGKTSWIRTLLSTCDLSHCSEETKITAAQFGIAASSIHPTRRTDPTTPLATRSIDYLGGIELQTNSLLPIASLHQQAPVAGAPGMRPPSHASTRASIFSNTTSNVAAKRLHLSICDTPGIDIDIEDDFETQRKVAMIIKHVEGKLTRTLAEEGKVQRKSKTDDYVHLIVYFIDPRHLVERSETRRREVRQSRGGNGINDEKRGRSNSESHATHGRPSGYLKNRDSSTNVNGDAEEGREDETSIEGLSEADITIISKMSKFANVLPIIAKADTLTMARLYEVRQAIRRSLKNAKIDLGTFDIASSVNRRKKHNISRNEAVVSRNEPIEMMAAEEDQHLPRQAAGKEEVKVVRVRSRRAYSASGPRPASDVFGHAEESDAGHHNNASLARGNSFQSTEPLFSRDAEEEEDENASAKAHEELLKLMPFSVFVPEPIQVYRKKKSQQYMRPNSAEDPDFDFTQQNGVPPVPPLPRIDGTNSASAESDDAPPRESEEIGTALSPGPYDYPHAYPLPPTALLPSERYERNYRWGTANVLDPDQCDFGILRSTIFGTHLEALKESTTARYEAFRSRRLELNRQLREGSASEV